MSALVFSVYIPFVQNYFLTKIESEVGDYLQADVSVESFNLSFFADINLLNTIIVRNQDSLLQLNSLCLDLEFSPLLHHRIVINDLRLDGLRTDLLSLLPETDTTEIDSSSVDDAQDWSVEFNHISIDNSYIVYDDQESNTIITIDIGSATVKSMKINGYIYETDAVVLVDTKIDYSSPFDPNAEIDTSKTQFVFVAQTGDLQNVEFTYNDSLMRFATGGHKIYCSDLVVDVEKEDVKFADIELDTSYFNLVFMNDTLDTIQGTSDWKVHCDVVKMENSNFTLDVSYLPEDKEYFDNNHIHFSNMNVEALKLFYSENNISLKLVSGTFVENDRVYIEQSSGSLYADNSQLRLGDFQLKLKNSSYQLNGSMGYHLKSFDFTNNRDVDFSFNCKIDAWNEVDYFTEKALNDIEGIEKIHGKSIYLKSQSKGNLHFLSTDIEAIYDHTLRLKTKGELKNISNKDSLSFNFEIANFEILKKNIKPFISDKSTLAYIPERCDFEGSIAGTAKKSRVKGVFASDYGTQDLDIFLDMSQNQLSVKAIVEGNIMVDKYDKFEVQYFLFDGNLKGESLANIIMNAKIEMQGIQIDTLVYDSLFADIEIEDEHYVLHINSKDEHAMFKILSYGQINDSLIASKSQLDVISFSFKESDMLIFPEVLTMNSQISFDYNFNNSNTIITADFHNISLSDTIAVNTVKSMNISYNHSEENTHFSLKSDNNTIEARVFGNIDTLINNFNTLVDVLVLENNKNNDDSLSFPDITLYADIGDPYELLGKNVAHTLPVISAIMLDAKYTNSNRNIEIDLFVPHFAYDGNVMDSTSLQLSGGLNGFDYALVSQLYFDSIFHTNLKVDGDFKQRQLFTHIDFSGRDGLDFIDIEFLSKEEGLGYLISIPEDTVIILSNKWHVKNDNSLLIEPSHFEANNIDLFRANKEIRIETNEAQKEIGLILKNIDLSVFNTLLPNDSVLGGNVNMDISASYTNDVNKLYLKAKVDTFKYENYTIGNIEVSKANFDDKQFVFSSTLSGKWDKGSVEGIVKFDEHNSIDVDVDLQTINLDFVNTYLEDYLYDVKGSINSKMKIEGNIDAPILNGYFRFVDSQLGLKDLNEVFKINNEKIILNNNRIYPTKLEIIDQNNHKSFFDGVVDISNNTLEFNNFHIRSEAMELMNSKKEDNQMVFGKIVAKFDVKLSGAIDDLTTKSFLEFNYPTVVNYTFPEDLSVSKNDGIVNFTKIDTLSIIDSTLNLEMKSKQLHLMNVFKFLDAELVVDDGCKFNLYFDNSMDNYLNVALEGSVKYLFSDEVPKTSGLLNIINGRLSYSMPMVEMEELNITDNSFIQITNEVDNPFVSINAVSKIWAQTGDLVEGYNRNLEVEVYVYMRGTLDNLVMQFDVSSQTSDALISSKISQMSEKERTMNAVNLLIRGQFASKQSNVTIDVNSYVNSLLAKALNKLISERISFVDMSFDIKSVKSINSSGAIESQSDLFFNVGKSFYHDRIRVNYRGNMSSQTTQNAQQYSSTDSYTESDLSIEYDITKNGNFQAVLFRKNTYEDIMEGEIISSGGGLRIRKSYNTFAEIFKSKSKEKSSK